MENKNLNDHFYYLGMAKLVAQKSTCLRKRFGSVLVKDGKVVSSGANYSPCPVENCLEIGSCFRKENNIKSHTRMDVCRALTAEQCTVLLASPSESAGAVLYTYGEDIETGEELRGKPHQVSVKPLLLACVRAVVHSDLNGGFSMIHLAPDFAKDERHIQL